MRLPPASHGGVVQVRLSTNDPLGFAARVLRGQKRNGGPFNHAPDKLPLNAFLLSRDLGADPPPLPATLKSLWCATTLVPTATAKHIEERGKKCDVGARAQNSIHSLSQHNGLNTLSNAKQT